MPRLQSDLVELMLAAASGNLLEVEAEWEDKTALTVVLASKGYPGSYDKNTLIEGVDDAEKTGALVFHAGTAERDGQLLATGGRVLNVTGFGASVSEAQQAAYDAVSKIRWDNGFCRTDIGWRAIAREEAGS